jgi:hypothetical protein
MKTHCIVKDLKISRPRDADSQRSHHVLEPLDN